MLHHPDDLSALFCFLDTAAIVVPDLPEKTVPLQALQAFLLYGPGTDVGLGIYRSPLILSPDPGITLLCGMRLLRYSDYTVTANLYCRFK